MRALNKALTSVALLGLFFSTVPLASEAHAGSGTDKKPGPGSVRSPAPVGSMAGLTATASDGSIAASGTLAGVQVTNDLRCYVQRAGYSTDEFFGPGLCGTHLGVEGVLYGITGTPWTPVNQATSGSGSATDPWKIQTEVAAGSTGVSLVETDEVVDGESGYRTSIKVRNSNGTARTVTVFRAGDCYVAGSDYGYGDLPGSGVACLNQSKDQALTLTPISEGATVQEDYYGTIWGALAAMTPLSNSAVSDSAIDNGLAIRWERTVNAASSIELVSRLDLTLFVGQPPSETDSDADGLPDSWETGGARDANGNVIYDLASMGAKKDHADIFIQVVAEKSAPLSADARKIIVDSFAKAPTSNPDGTSGINVHFVDGPQLTWNESDSLKTVYNAESDGSQDWHGPWRQWLSWAPHGPSVFHYVASVNWSDAGFGGIANIDGQMSIVNNCGSRSSSRTTCKAAVTDQAANFMHELGHNLNLRHGGGDDIRYKPNYFSVMNYFYSHTGVPGVGVDFSHWGTESINVLDENSLAEPDGVIFKNAPVGLKVYHMCPGAKSNDSNGWKSEAVNKRIDWNCQKKIQGGRVVANIDGRDYNNNETLELLRPFNDWANILLTTNDSNLGFTTVDYRVGETQF